MVVRVSAPAIIGEEQVMSSKPWDCTMSCLNKCRLLTIHRSDYVTIMRQDFTDL